MRYTLQYQVNEQTGHRTGPWDCNHKNLLTLCRPRYEAAHKKYTLPVLKNKFLVTSNAIKVVLNF